MENISIVEKNQNNKQLQRIAGYLYKKYFHHTLHCAVTFDKTLEDDNLLGDTFYHWDLTDKPHIFINPYEANEYNNSEAIDTIKHELIHYYLFKINDKQGYGHTKHFYKIAKKIGVYRKSNSAPWSLKYPVCKKNYEKYYNKPVYFYYSYKIGVYCKWYCMYSGSHVTDKYDKKRAVHYLGFLPTYVLFPTIKHARKIVHKYSNLSTQRIVNKLADYILHLRAGKCEKYVDRVFDNEDKQRKKHKIQRIHELNALRPFKHAVNKDNITKIQTFVNKMYQKYFHQGLHCEMILKVNANLPKFKVKNHHAYIYIGMIGANSYDGTFTITDAKDAVSKLKLCLLHYYLWSVYNVKANQCTQQFYNLADKKFGMVLQPEKKPVHIVQNPRKDFRTLYYCSPIGVFWTSEIIDCENHYIYVKNYKKPQKAYYIGECCLEDYNKYYKYLNKRSIQYKKEHLNNALIAKRLYKDSKHLDYTIYGIKL